ncbi:pyrroline-5-carboxylate reductase [Sphingomonas bacterium]|uniref:pyrroline-5-carboxylate reductase family protein n=1 Tax=Sphingomonas bacterium TaxID=1895847 RepID=UPI00266EFB9D|nr:pyrroline-5-carboxylate reductase [Sphingomonas bacterium]
MTPPFAAPLWLIGCGTMGGAMLRRWVDAGGDPALVTVVTRSGATVPPGVRSVTAVPIDAEPATIMLAVKPQQLDVVAPMLEHVETPLLVSILAGVEEAALAARFRTGAIVRAMPNLPVAIGKGVTALHTASQNPMVRAAATALATPLGLVEWIDDAAQFDAVTALAGCGPGFTFRFVDALAAAGVSLGLGADQARRLAVATVEGSGAMAARSDVSPAVLADRVASPGGSTREGLNVLDADGALVGLLTRTLAASARRHAEMAAAAR